MNASPLLHEAHVTAFVTWLDAKEQTERTRKTEVGRQNAIAARGQSFGYSDFIRDFGIEKPSYWFGFEIRKDGVYVSVPDDDEAMSAKERAERSWHHEGDVTKPALGFPYDIDGLHAFSTAYHLAGVLPNDDVYWMLEGLSEPGSPEMPASKGAQKEELIDHFRLPDNWKDKLAHLIVKYLSPPVLVCRGRPGKGGSALFNPTEFGAMLIRKKMKNSSGYTFDITKVNTIIEQHFKTWNEEWQEVRNRDFGV